MEVPVPEEDTGAAAGAVGAKSQRGDAAAAGPPVPPRAPEYETVVARSLESATAKRPVPPDVLDREAEQHRRMAGVEHALPRRRRVFLPVMLFAITCASTFWAGCSGFLPEFFVRDFFGDGQRIRQAMVANWQEGLIYMTCVLAILFSHEMGHFLMTLRYRIAASLPYFLPVPVTPIGTMGAVISMDGLSANRRQMFDIGLAGPIAGLIVAIPITWYGVAQLDLTDYQPMRIEREIGHGYDLPVMMTAMLNTIRPDGYENTGPIKTIPTSLLNPYLMAGWVGLLITGLNMLPISQLDGGHVIYALFGKRAHVIARLFLFVAIFFVVCYFEKAFIWLPMIILVTLIGTDHPPTADDRAPLGWFRTAIGFASLVIPLLCFPPFGLRVLGM